MKGPILLKSIKLGLILTVILLIPALVAVRLYMLNEQAKPKLDTASSKDSGKDQKEDFLFFKALVDHGLVYPAFPEEPESRQLTFAFSDLKYEVAERMGTETDIEEKRRIKEKIQLLKQLYGSQVGLAVQRAVSDWNGAHWFAAVRDNRPGKSRADLWAGRDPEFKGIFLDTVSHVPEFAVFVNGPGMSKGFHPWQRSATGNGKVQFSSHIEVTVPLRLTVQVVGRLSDIAVKDLGRGKKLELGDSSIRIHKRAIPDPGLYHAFSGLWASESDPGSEITLCLEAGQYEIQLTVDPVRFSGKRIPGLNLCWDNQKSWPDAVSWQDLATEGPGKGKPFSIATSDDVVLVGQDGKGTKALWDLGLVPVAGAYPGHYGTLSGIVVNPEKDGKVMVTINGALQALAQEALENRIQTLWGDRKDDPYASLRRGAVVMIDADSGEILAAAGYPRCPSGVDSWDLRAFSTYYPNQNLYDFHPWKNLNSYNTPGSSFKPVVAMAAGLAAQAQGNNSALIARMMEGVTKDELNQVGLSAGCAGYHPLINKCYPSNMIPKDPLVVENFNRFPLGRGFTHHGDKVLGVREMLRDSVNIWFVRLGELMDGDAASNYDQAWLRLKEGQAEPGNPKLFIGQMAEKLGFNSLGMDLLFNLTDSLPMRRQRPDPEQNREGDNLFAAAGSLKILETKARGMERILARNSFGQGMTASPLQMAKVAGAVATAKICRPYIISRINGKTQRGGQSSMTGVNEKWLTGIRAGMKAVTESGSASSAFENFHGVGDVYGKTGTARPEQKKKIWTAWFTGYREPMQKENRRLAFACMITHTWEDKKYTGGYIAAPVIREILEKMDSQWLTRNTN